MSDSGAQYHVVVVGGGVAGLEIATTLGRRWRRQRPQNQAVPKVTLIDSDSAHVWKPMLHTIAAGTRDMAAQQVTYVTQAYDSGFIYQPGELCGLDRTKHEVLLAPLYAADGRLLIPERRLVYHKLILAVGSQANDFGTLGVGEHCWMIDSRRQADAFNHELRIHMLRSLTQDLPLDIAIIGGGATGVELAAELVQLVEASAAYGAQGIAERITVTLIESGSRLLAAFPEDISSATRRRLEALGICVLTDTKVSAVTADGLAFGDGRKMRASLKIWAAGVKAPEFLAHLDGLETNRSNQLVVLPSLQTSRDPDIYAVGDCSSLTLPKTSRPLPPTAQVAHQQAQYLIRHLPRIIQHQEEPPPFAYRDFGALVSLSNYDAYGSLGKFGLFRGRTIRGHLAQLSHVMLYRSHQARLYGVWRGSLVWLVDCLNARLRAKIRLD
ncbi:NAD(P)/FAD-dependent oxidoreductase [Acidocella aminolytica]|uniref:NADH dehydrogenase n=1 Tax=Acidocella aminolytica 101 = DSM 11237 TaxID=1120923 RepID=A0A0D6PFA5_9PROT|nr:FAD-dependent oxidoreductase [Acidocella aminolytica]GAN80347.1 NADH dehydrogenase [Acidocella aminolytica 101 = DSM 11237]GBQ42949.1 FAD-dependent NADH dehydrogenase [Acidocella aminolytica 101 = DSM 11237]SHE29661.1 NADH dehydrogenase [Acidocella aminolytica 101 = DSM 11237]